MPLRPDMEVSEYLGILQRRKWLAIFSFLFVVFGAAVYCVLAPELYKSSTTILIIPQRVPENFVQSTVSGGVEDRLATIQQQVNSRTNLVKVMDELGLFKELRGKKLPEEVLEKMQKQIEINVMHDKDRRREKATEAFTISFAYADPKLAMLTASRLASMFIDENLKTREQQAVGTSDFLDSQLHDTKVTLEALEERLKEYKLRFMGELPQELQTNLNTLTRLQDQYKTNADGIRAAQDRQVFLQAQLGMLERSLESAQDALAAQGATQAEGTSDLLTSIQDPAQPLLAELTLKRSRLSDLTAKYTDKYPEVVRLRYEVEQLEKKIEELRKTPPQAPPGPVATRRSPQGAAAGSRSFVREMDEIRHLRAQVIATETEISSLKAQREGIQKNITAFQERVDRSPRREQEMISLTRDYENMKLLYDDLLKKKLEADISQNLEKRQKGEQFQIIDPANLPEKPFQPDRKKIMGIALGLAFALGIGGAFALEIADPTLRGVKDFKHYFAVPVLACIPAVPDTASQRKTKLRRAAVLGGVVSFVTLVTAFLVLYGGRVRAILNIG